MRLRRHRETRSLKPVFSLDVHQSVVSDLALGMLDSGIDLLRWSISSHNFVNRRFLIAPDPVKHVNAYTWKALDENVIDAFQDRYSSMLKSFSGFLVCYPFAFSELFRGLDRPILAVSATRYEVPYTLQNDQWLRLNGYLADLHAKGLLHLAANNRGDAGYLEYFLNIPTGVVPSVCDYTGSVWAAQSHERVVFSRIPEIEKDLLIRPGSNWRSAQQVFGRRFSWERLSQVREVFVLPYNISTMFLFELATAGVPVTVPSPNLYRRWIASSLNPLSELSFFQLLDGSTASLAADNPNNYGSTSFYDWWLDRADFYDPALMPNVRVVDSLDEAIDEPHPVTLMNISSWRSIIRDRNSDLRSRRNALLSDFAESL
jgi:hypothetical protein